MARRGQQTRRRAGARKSSDKTTPIVIILVAVLVLGIGVYSFMHFWKAPQVPPTAQPPVANAPEKAPVSSPDEIDAMVQEMSLEEKAYQMLFVTPESITGVGQAVAAGQATKDAVERYPVGGMVYFAQNILSPDQTKTMLHNTQSYAKIPLFLAVDEEGGRVSRIASNPDMGVEEIPSMWEIGETGDVTKAYEVGEELSDMLTELGFNVDFAPVADLLVNADNTAIGDRAFGDEPGVVSDMVAATVDGLQTNGVSATLKHFPGHGSTTEDSHNGYTASTRSYAQLSENEFLPFRAGIEADADFVMISHITMVSAVEEDVPASLSKTVVTDWLIEELGYKGIIITDSFRMNAITDNYAQSEAIVMAIDAGVDMILMPTDTEAAKNAIVEAVKSGKLSEERIDASVKKILSCKAKRGLL